MITERPWKYTDTMIVDTAGFTIARSGHVHDAAHIVRCVNEREGLLAALKLTQRNIDSLRYMLPVDAPSEDKESLRVWSETVQDAIAATEKETL